MEQEKNIETEEFTIEKVETKNGVEVQRARSMGHAILQLLWSASSIVTACGCFMTMPNVIHPLESVAIGTGGINLIGLAFQQFSNYKNELKRPTKKEIENNPTEFTIEKVTKTSNKKIQKTVKGYRKMLRWVSFTFIYSMMIICAHSSCNISTSLFEFISCANGTFGLLLRMSSFEDIYTRTVEEDQKEKTK